ncbi:hypothetical protein ACIHCQ_30020 [Streptomyces sp. NPDC052236]|uniref:hypothetical protein n=1 Tax=Streptomyces sp. NPDC052236 TaxID=3365686 RepID=UPI0037D17F43
MAAGKYSLALPFTALMLDRLAAPGGFVAQLTANSFMKREFGRRYVVDFLPRVGAHCAFPFLIDDDLCPAQGAAQ